MKWMRIIERGIAVTMGVMLLIGLIVWITERNTNPVKGVKRERIYRIKD
jgi:hypothetical protein